MSIIIINPENTKGVNLTPTRFFPIFLKPAEIFQKKIS